MYTFSCPQPLISQLTDAIDFILKILLIGLRQKIKLVYKIVQYDFSTS